MVLRRWIARAVVTAAALGGVVGAGSAAQAGDAGYVAIGDSYASGVGAGNYRDAVCRQSVDGSYPVLWAKAKGLTLTDRTCSGATVATVRAGQLADLNDRTRWVTITVGGNDIGFTTTFTQCVVGSEGDCHTAVQGSIGTMLTSLPGSLEGLFTEVAGRAPNAHIVVTGYPHLVAEAGASCGTLTDPKRAALNHGADVLNEVLRNKATRSQFSFVDVRAAFAGHEACSARPWVHGLVFTGEAFHPTRDGYAAYGRELVAATR
jgi:lysophospholipase L1-like esterase